MGRVIDVVVFEMYLPTKADEREIAALQMKCTCSAHVGFSFFTRT